MIGQGGTIRTQEKYLRWEIMSVFELVSTLTDADRRQEGNHRAEERRKTGGLQELSHPIRDIIWLWGFVDRFLYT